jgi:hypothetical protein
MVIMSNALKAERKTALFRRDVENAMKALDRAVVHLDSLWRHCVKDDSPLSAEIEAMRQEVAAHYGRLRALREED